MKIWFDMDGTIADLYGVNNWLTYLERENVKPYMDAKPLVRMNVLARLLNKLQEKGYEIGVISWTSKSGSREYNNIVKAAKQIWLATHLKSVKFDNVLIVDYGTDKFNACGNDGILFDDEERNRNAWMNGKAFDPCQMMEVLRGL